MIDFHTHIIPNIDDGSKSVEETFNLIKEAKAVGFHEIISTSHYLEKHYETDEETRKIWLDAIGKGLESENIQVKLYIGSEIYFSENILKLLRKHKASCIAGTSYVLFEMPLNAKPLNLYDIVYEMLSNHLRPILAHPERYSFIQNEPSLVYDLIQKGVLMQANYGSILGLYGTKSQILVKKLLEHNMIHFLGTDVHKEKSIYLNVPEAIKEIKKIVGADRLYELTTLNAKYVLKNKNINIETPKEIKFTIKEKLEMKIKK